MNIRKTEAFRQETLLLRLIYTMDRNTTIGYVLIFVLFIAFYFINKKNVEDIENSQKASDSTEIVSSPNMSEIQADSTSLSISTIDSFSVVGQQIDTIPETYIQMENEVLEVVFSSKGARPYKARLKDYTRYGANELVLFEGDETQFYYLMNLRSGMLRTDQLSFHIDSSEINADEPVLRFWYQLPEGGKMVQTYTLQKDKYTLDYRLELENAASNFALRDKYFELNWSARLQNQEKTLEAERENSTVYYKYLNEDDAEYIGERKEDREELQGNLHWVSYKQKFFNTTLIAKNGFEEEGSVVETKNATDDSYVKEISSSLLFHYDGNPRASYDMAFYIGPNHYQTLKKTKVGLENIVPLGWGIFGWVNRFLIIPVFNFLNNYFVSYGIIIFLLTIAIKVVLFPLMYRSYLSMAKMRVLKPELDELKANAGGDMQKMQTEQMKLYKKAGVSPFGGCLPLVVQMPILYAMFRFFPSSIELRQEPLWWTDDLSTYDSILDLGFSIPFYGDHVSMFTLLMTISTFLYTMMNNQMTGATGQMKIISYVMPIMFLGFFNNYPAALSFYYFLANMITFTQNWIIRKFFVDEEKIHKQIQENKKKPVSLKKSRMQKRLEDMAKKRGIDPYTGKKKK